MMLSFWGWVLVAIVIWAIFDYDNLPKYKEKLIALINSKSACKSQSKKDNHEDNNNQ